ncbi:MAG: type II CRISPR-associated endonuclease Cas1 [Bacteroidota bacterium]
MIKRTLYFGNPAYLSKTNDQLVLRLPEVEKNDSFNVSFKKEAQATIPIEDIGIVMIDHQQITITQALITALVENNVALITCDATHHPIGLMLPLEANSLQSERFQAQIDASLPLKKQLWQQTVTTKIYNQAMVLKQKNIAIENMLYWSTSVKSGDPDNYEGRAAAYYWKSLAPLLSPSDNEFRRDRFGDAPNNLLNYGYAILRAIVARGLVGSGLLPTLGIHHRNKYNAYCLADDIMEPYRPYVDIIVCDIIAKGEDFKELTTSIKQQLLAIASVDVNIDGSKSPLMVGLQRTTSSLAKCYEGTQRKIIYPEL